MAWSEKAKSGGGGAREGKITDYEFTNYFPLGDDTDATDNIYMRLELTPDGEDAEPVNIPMYLGSGKYLVICDEEGDPVEDGAGKILKGGEDGEVDEENTPRLFDQGEVFKFIASLEEAGFPAEARFPDPEETQTLDFRAMLGWRIRVSNEVDKEATDKLGKRKVKKGKHKGKEFNRTWTKVVKVLGEPEEGGKKAKKGASKETPSAKTTKGGKAGKKASSKDEDDEQDEDEGISAKVADKFMLGLLKANKGKVDKDGLPLAITRYAAKLKMDNDERDPLRKHLMSSEYLDDAAEREVISYDAKAKKKVIALPEGDEDSDDE